MRMIATKVHLPCDERFGTRLPPFHIGHLLVEIPLAIRESISMAFLNRSNMNRRRPNWLAKASDIRFVDHQNGDGVNLFFEAPQLGEAAEEIYRQQSLFPELRPDPSDTGFDLFGDVLKDVRTQNSDSETFDSALLRRITRFRNVFKNSPFREFDFITQRQSYDDPVKFSESTIESATLLLGRTPASQRIRLVGKLDGLEASTQRFSVLLDSGEKVNGVFSEDQIEGIQHLWRSRVLVLGTAIYRASGRLLRIEAEAISEGDGQPSLFSKMPQVTQAKLDQRKLRRPQGPRSGMAAIMGAWPGDETDEEIESQLGSLS